MNSSSILRRPFRYSNGSISIYLICANVLVFGLGFVFQNLPYYLALNPQLFLSGMFWQPLTYMFAHASPSHLIFNMLGLVFFAPQIERELGSKEFLFFYLLTGLLSGLASLAIYLATGAMGVFLLGASGVVYAVLLAFAVLFPGAEIYVFGLLPVKAPILVAAYAVIELWNEVFGVSLSVAHLTHLSGLLFAWLYFVVRYGINPWRRLFPRR